MKDRSKALFGFVMILMMVGIISFSYALFTTKIEKKGALNIVAGDVSCPLQSSDLTNNQITLQAKEVKEITVTLTNQSIIDIHSMITYSGSSNIEVLAASSNENEIELQSVARGIMLTYTLKLKNNGTSSEVITLNGRCGLSNKALALNEGETKIEGKYYKDKSGANVPKLVEGLIPVYYDEGKWKKADTTQKWYDYNNQEWANAVTVVEKTAAGENGHDREYYLNADPGTPINMDDINTMWVWIPRYEYDYQALQKLGSIPGEIDIKFIDTTKTSITEIDNYKVHPAFDFGGEQLEGFWYGKFETSSKKSCSPSNGSIGNGCDVETNTLQIKPGVTSWGGIRVSTAFTVSQKMAKNATEYGFSGSKIDTHMSKNSEWGAVAYLSQSKYGKYGKDQTEVLINSCSSHTTGVAACGENYTSTNGLKTSTTGNITGVYDMSGGAWEYVMGALTDGNNKPRSGYDASKNSGFNGVLDSGGPVTGQRDLPEEKYYDLYTNTTSVTACDGGVCYGHALSETEGWYSDYSIFISSTAGPWFLRGGLFSNSSNAGVFAFGVAYGSAVAGRSFRLALVNTGI